MIEGICWYCSRRTHVVFLGNNNAFVVHFFFLLIVPVSVSFPTTVVLLFLSLFCGCTTRGMFVLLDCFCWCCCCCECWDCWFCECCECCWTELALMTILGSVGFLTVNVVAVVACTAGQTLLGTLGTTKDLCSSGMVSCCGCLLNDPGMVMASVFSFFLPNVDDTLGGGGGGIFPDPSGMPANGGGNDSLRSGLGPLCAGKSGNTFGYLIRRTPPPPSEQESTLLLAPFIAYSLEVTFTSS